MSQIPDIFSGALAGITDFVPSVGQKASQIAIQNLDGADSFTLKVNGSNPWTLAPGEKLVLRFKNEICKVTLAPVSGSPTYQLILK